MEWNSLSEKNKGVAIKNCGSRAYGNQTEYSKQEFGLVIGYRYCSKKSNGLTPLSSGAIRSASGQVSQLVSQFYSVALFGKESVFGIRYAMSQGKQRRGKVT